MPKTKTAKVKSTKAPTTAKAKAKATKRTAR